MFIKKSKALLKLVRDAFFDLRRNDPLRLGAATAFFTTFALPPILIILIQVFGAVLNMEDLGDRFFERFAKIMGSESSRQIKRTFLGFKSLANNWYITLGGSVFLIFVSTTLFKVVKDSLNQIWCVKVSRRKAFKNTVEKRFASMAVILLAGMLFITATLAEGVQGFLSHHLNEFYQGSGLYVNKVLNQAISITVVTIWFSVLFKLLPDAKLSWKVAVYGALFTAILFTIGKFLIKMMLGMGDLATIFGASASIVLFLLFVFYSSIILYYGACFTNVYANSINDPIAPGDHAVKYRIVEIEEPKKEEGDKESSDDEGNRMNNNK